MELFRIGTVSKLCRIPIKTLRYYDEIGLLNPECVNQESKYRYYSQKCIMQISMIKYFKSIGFTLDQIKDILNRTDDNLLARYLTDMQAGLYREAENINRRISAIQGWNRLIETSREKYAKRSAPPEVTEEVMPAYHVLPLKHSFDQSRDFTEIIYEISNQFTTSLENEDFLTFGSFLAHYPDIRLRLSGKLSGTEFYSEVMPNSDPVYKIESIGEKRVLKAIHIGAYAKISITYDRIRKHAEENAMELEQDSYELYAMDPWSTCTKDNYITEIMVPVCT